MGFVKFQEMFRAVEKAARNQKRVRRRRVAALKWMQRERLHAIVPVTVIVRKLEKELLAVKESLVALKNKLLN